MKPVFVLNIECSISLDTGDVLIQNIGLFSKVQPGCFFAFANWKFKFLTEKFCRFYPFGSPIITQPNFYCVNRNITIYEQFVMICMHIMGTFLVVLHKFDEFLVNRRS